MRLLVLFLTINIALSQTWQLVGEDLTGFTVSSSSWNFKNTCDWNSGTAGSVSDKDGCALNNIEYILIGSNSVRAYYQLTNLPPHYQVKVLVDGYFLDSSGGTFYTVAFDCQGSTTSTYSLQYKDSLLQSYQGVCTSSGWNNFEIQTFNLIFVHNDNTALTIRACGSNFSSSRDFGLRNFQVYISPCHWSCLTCLSGSGASNCKSCYTNPSVTLASQGTCSSCPTNSAFIEFLDITKTCTLECHYYRVPDANKVCQFNENMLPFETYFDADTFTTTSPWIFVPDQINYNLVYSQKIDTIPCQTSKNYVGPFYYNEGISLTLSLPYNISYIRFRVTIMKFGSWDDYTSVQVLLQSIEQASIYSISDILYDRNADNSYSDQNCTSPVVSYYRIESQLKTNLTNPVLLIKGNMDSNGLQSWGFRNVVMDIMRCQSTCSWCDYDLKCYACSTGYLYKNRCIPSCPVHSVQTTGKCTDYDEAIANSNYLIKAFYDTGNTTDVDVPGIVGSMTGGGSEFKTSDHFIATTLTTIYYGYYSGKRVLGGPLIWNSATFTKTFTSLNPHYKYNLKFKLVLGDTSSGNFQGDFRYTIGGYGQQTITASGASNTVNNVGKSNQDKLQIIDITQVHTGTSLTVVLFCNSSQNVDINFCLLYDYFLILLECTDYCTVCTGPTWAECTTKQTLPTGMTSPTACVDNTYYLDTSVTPAVCRDCTPSYCQQCSNASICTLCDSNFYLSNGNCQCYPWTYLSGTTCVSCNPLCSSCYGGLSTNCLSCSESQHRSINNNQCVCQAHYYDDGINNTCQSICGDMVVTDGEDCDDGNTIRFDGCNNCKYECQKECSVCVNGQCSVCKIGYTLNQVMKKCYATCGDSIIVTLEQCEDGNLTPYDGCYNCQFQCQLQCINCVNGICYQCDNTIGYYINLSTYHCEPYCGDGMIAGVEFCDDGNINPFDGCHNCFYSCDTFCANCIFGICTKCQSGYQLMSNTNQCGPICGDGIVTYYEQCDDANYINYDGCDWCSLECQSYCTSCQLGKCYQCSTLGWKLDVKQLRCIPNCGDGTATGFYEQCDDSNGTFEDGCYQCQYSCQAECTNCVLGICLQCKTNYYLGSDNLCYPVCGDGAIVKFEQCDDQNYMYQDGCQSCTFQCEASCKICSFGVCQSCISGYYLNSAKKKCFPICGDSLQLGDEQCDYGILTFGPDQNNYIGCLNCQLSCSPQCEICAKGTCQKCKESKGWYLDYETGQCLGKCGDQVISDLEQCDDSNSELNDGCVSCQFSCQQECSNCIFGICYSCYLGYKLIDNKCYSVCGDGIVVGNEECDIGMNQLTGYGCVSCKYKCSEGCNYCFKGQCLECSSNQGWYLDSMPQQCSSKCGDLVISKNEQCDDQTSSCLSCYFVCPDSCKQCLFGQCSACQSGYELYENNCVSICGDQINTKSEDCEDTDLIPFDSCFKCQFQCQDSCLLCIKGECASCDESQGWYLNDGKCQSYCGDGIIADLEECDIPIVFDQGDVSQNTCFNCKLSCVNNCQVCEYGRCQQCKANYYLTELNDCINICGTNLPIEQVSKQCDDNNLDPFDGCHSCQFNCQSECLYCINGICLQCQNGFNLIQDKCYSQCGDKIVDQLEQCDDGNEIEFDGCHLCQYSCAKHCQSCNNGICESCEIGYKLQFPYCEFICTDIMRYNNNEECLYQDCSPECLQCIKGKCYQCKNGWNWNSVELICESRCGDGNIVDLEQCESSLLVQGWNSLNCSNSCQYICPLNCKSCLFGICSQCQNGYHLDGNECVTICGDNIVTDSEKCDDGNEISNDGCHLCQFDCPLNCATCINGLCELCEGGYFLDSGNCTAICGDGIIKIEEQCDDSNTELYDGCYQCKFQCDNYCQECVFGKCLACQDGLYLDSLACEPICGDGLVLGNEQCDDKNLVAQDGCFDCQSSCQQECVQCLEGECILCNQSIGWYLSSTANCETQCGDMIVAGNEQCDDGNDVNNDGCADCYYECQDPCTKCLTGSCYECNTPGWLLDNFKCWEICGDGLTVGIEECDDGNNVPYDGCFTCLNQCEEACITCDAGQCQECTIGWLLNSISRCETVCGDQFVLPVFEDCDDGNLIPFDGCYECTYQCVQYCTDCRQGICYECNTDGWTFDKSTKSCIPYCGDGVVTGNEICDDGNQLEYDGCDTTCQYSCHQACINCEKGICLACDQFQGYVEQNNQCASLCGDGLWEKNTEQCDDGNVDNFDGCSDKCRIELNWYCNNQQLSISNCQYKKQPTLLLELVGQTDKSATIKVSFSTKMMLSQQLNAPTANILDEQDEEQQPSNFIAVSIDELSQNDYNYSVLPIVEVETEPKDVTYNIELLFNDKIMLNKVNLIIVVNNDMIFSDQQEHLIENVGQLVITIPYQLSEQELRISKSVADMSEMQVYSQLGLSVVTIFTSGFHNFFTACDTLQYLYYTRYINLNFPDNLQMEMKTFQKSSFSQIATRRFAVEQQSNSITQKQPDETLSTKFRKDNLSSQFITNIKTSLTAFAAGLVIFVFTFTISKLLHLIPPSTLDRYGKYIGGPILTIRQKCTKISGDFIYSGAIRLITVNFYELTFASLIQLQQFKFNNLFDDILNVGGAIGTLTLQSAFIIVLFHQIRQMQTKQSINMKHYINTLFTNNDSDGNKSLWVLQYNTILQAKKMLYIFLIVNFQQQPLYQTISVGMQGLAFAGYLFVSQPFSKSDDMRKALITELGMCINSMSFILYYTNSYFDISQEVLVQLGWFNIGIYSTILTSNLLIDSIGQVMIVYKKVKKIINKFISSQQPSQSRVQPIFV